MKRKRFLLTGILLGAIVGWALGYLRLPYLDKQYAFWIGLVAGMGVVMALVALLFAWNKHQLLLRFIGKGSKKDNPQSAVRAHSMLWILISLFILAGGLISSVVVYQQNKLFRAQVQEQNKRINEQSALLESMRQSNMGQLLAGVLEQVEEDLKINPGGVLSEATIARVAALSYSFRPYRYFDGDSLSSFSLSPERGQLLLALSIMPIDSTSFAKIKQGAPFFQADLRGADLEGADLSGIDLKEADLRSARLSGANLRKADLRGANLWGAKLDHANLSEADLKRADLRWAIMNDAILESVDGNGIQLANAQLLRADMRTASFQWSDLSGALLNEADLEGGDVFNAIMKNVNLTNANLKNVLLRNADLDKAILTGVTLTNSQVEEDWLEKLEGWHATGTQAIVVTYKIVDIEPGTSNSTRFRLRSKTEKTNNEKEDQRKKQPVSNGS